MWIESGFCFCFYIAAATLEDFGFYIGLIIRVRLVVNNRNY